MGMDGMTKPNQPAEQEYGDVYVRPAKHQNWKHYKYQVIVGNTIVCTHDSENSSKMIANAINAHLETARREAQAGVYRWIVSSHEDGEDLENIVSESKTQLAHLSPKEKKS